MGANIVLLSDNCEAGMLHFLSNMFHDYTRYGMNC